MALLVVLERLSPAERTAFLLHDVFGFGFEEVAGVVGRTPAAVRQLASRARRHVEDGWPSARRAEQQRLVAASLRRGQWRYAAACRAARPRWSGAPRWRQSNALLGYSAAATGPPVIPGDRAPPGRAARGEGAGGLPTPVGPVLTVIAFTIDAGRITAHDVMRNPDKLGGVAEPG